MLENLAHFHVVVPIGLEKNSNFCQPFDHLVVEFCACEDAVVVVRLEPADSQMSLW